MKYKYFKVVYPAGMVFVMKAKSISSLQRRLPAFGDVQIEEIRKTRTGYKRTYYTPPPGTPPPEEPPPREPPRPRTPPSERISLADRIKMAKRDKTGVLLYPDELTARQRTPPRPRTPPSEKIIKKKRYKPPLEGVQW